MIWDLSKITNSLIGKWDWKYIGCSFSSEVDNDDEFKGLKIEFKSDNTLKVEENGAIIQTSSWKVVNGDSDLFEIEADPSVDQLFGRILFCDKRLKFNDSYRDGCDNYFERGE